MILRSEKPSDIDSIAEVTKAAFDDISFDQPTEHLTIHDLRVAGALTISLVAEIDGNIVGHIALSPVTISDGTTNWYGLGPISVLPDYQGRQIGATLVSSGLKLLRSMKGNGIVLAGLPTYFFRFGFRNYPQLIHNGTPPEVFLAKSFVGRMPSGTVEFHQAFKQLSIIEKDAIADAIIDFAVAGIKVDLANPAIESLIKKEILTELPDGKVMIRPSALAAFDSYLAQVSQFRATEMSRVHKNPILAAIKHGNS